MVQFSWTKNEGDRKNPAATWANPGRFEIELHEWQIAVGPTYNLMEGVSIYGCPFYNYLKGEASEEDGKLGDIKGKGQVGGYIGGQFDVTENVALNAEFQLTSDAAGLGLGLNWKF